MGSYRHLDCQARKSYAQTTPPIDCSLYVFLLHLMGSFGCFDCCMKDNVVSSDQSNNQGGGLAIRILQFDYCFNDNLEGRRKDGLRQEG